MNEIFTKHDSVNCEDGNWITKKVAIDGNIWEFRCDKCGKGWSIADAMGLSDKLKKRLDEIKRVYE